MKKIAVLLAILCFCSASFAEMPEWSKPLKPGICFDDPVITNASAYVYGTFNSPGYATNIQISFNKSVGVPYYATVRVMGLWGGSTSVSYREFTLLFSSSQWHKSVNFPMFSYEEVYPATLEIVEYGPQ